MQCILCCISSSMRRGGYAFLCVWLGSYTLRLTQWVTMTITSATELIFLISASQGGYLLQILVLASQYLSLANELWVLVIFKNLSFLFMTVFSVMTTFRLNLILKMGSLTPKTSINIYNMSK